MDAGGDATVGDVLLEGSKDCYVRSDGVLTAVVGLQNAVVVVTGDGVLAFFTSPCFYCELRDV